MSVPKTATEIPFRITKSVVAGVNAKGPVKGATVIAMESASTVGRAPVEVVTSHPYAAVAVGVGAAVFAVPAILTSPALAVAGFGAKGVAGASIASGAQSAIGSVGAGSIFATLQSAGAGGYGVAVVSGAAQAGGAVLASAGGLAGWLGRKGNGA